MTRSVIPAERGEGAIVLLRGQKVMLDYDLADLYGVETDPKIETESFMKELAEKCGTEAVPKP